MNLFIANWKQNLNSADLVKWEDFFLKHKDSKNIIIAPHFLLLNELKNKTSLPLAAQDVSPFSDGPHTGRVGAKTLKDFVSYCLVGHSEMRREAGDTDKSVVLKIKRLLEADITPIVCLDLPNLQSQIDEIQKELIPTDKLIFAYEPLASIGTSKGQNPGFANEIALKIKAKVGRGTPVLYGGSVDKDNAKDYLEQEYINGLLIGTSSLTPDIFATIVAHG